MSLFRCGGGGSLKFDRLCYIKYRGKDQAEIPPISEADYGASFSEYCSYDSSTKKFTVLKEFTALVVPWVYSYATASGSNSKGQFRTNNNVVLASYTAPNRYKDSLAGTNLWHQFVVGDTFWNYTPSSDGYPQQMLKLYRIVNFDFDDISDLLAFSDENA